MYSNTIVIVIIVLLQSVVLPKFSWKYTVYILPMISFIWGIYDFIIEKNLISLLGYILLGVFLTIMGLVSYSDNREERQKKIAKNKFKNK